jgi:acetyl-CoA carboxylase biotin carboxyl carrier protein
MNIREIQQLIKIVEKSKIEEIEIEEEALKIRITKTSTKAALDLPAMPPQVHYMAPPAAASVAAAPAAPETPAAAAPAEAAPLAQNSNQLEIKSPMVGTFYAAPAPDAAPFVKVGDTVKKGQVLCIVEAMKLMNEIESEYDGRITEIVADNGHPVEYNQVLFRIDPL